MPGTPVEFITAVALIATLVARRGIGVAALRSSAVERIRTVCTVVAALLALRLLAPLLATPLLDVLVMLTAAWLPLAGLRMVEELCRRHADRWAKVAALGGAVGFGILALTVGAVWSTPLMIALALWQSAILVVMGGMLLRERHDLGPAERRAAETFLVVLLMTVPLAMTDFEVILPGAVVRGGPFAVLLLMLAVSRLMAGQEGSRQLFADLAVVLVAGSACGLLGTVVIPGLTLDRSIQVAAGGTAIAALLLLVERAGAARGRQGGLVAALADAPDGDRAALIASHPLLASGQVLGSDDLDAYPAASVARLLDHRVLRADVGDLEIRAAARDLLDATAATHLLRMSRNPPSFLAVKASGVAGPALDAELTVAARLIERSS